MSTDADLGEFRAWLRRIGYCPFESGIGINADCPNLLIRRIADNIQRACCTIGRKIHLIGHSFGGLLARALASQYPDLVRSVITLASPFRGITAHPAVLRVADWIRQWILLYRGTGVKPGCYTAVCTCAFARGLRRELSGSISQVAIYSRSDGVVDWRHCRTGNPQFDFEVPSTHTGMMFNPVAYEVVANCLARARRTSLRVAAG